MHVHMTPIALRYPTPQPAKALPAAAEARDAKRVNERLGGGGRGNSPQHQPPDRRPNERPREEGDAAAFSPIASLAMTLAALDLALATDDQVLRSDDRPPAPRASSIEDLLISAVSSPNVGT